MPPLPAGFLSVLGGSFDASLMLVMGGALLVALPLFQWGLRSGGRPLCAPCFDLPAKKDVDADLLVGMLLATRVSYPTCPTLLGVPCVKHPACLLTFLVQAPRCLGSAGAWEASARGRRWWRCRRCSPRCWPLWPRW